METIRLFLNTILIFNIIITVYYFNDLENYCKTENKLCINDPKRELIINTSVILLIFIIIIRYIKLDGSFNPTKYMKIIPYFTLISMIIISLYRVYIIYEYLLKLKENCNCEEYTVEYYLIKYHNLFQIFGLFVTMILLMGTIIFLLYYKKKYINIK